MFKHVAIAILSLLPLITFAHDTKQYKIIKHPRKECWKERVHHDASDYTGAVIGGLAGGILGNQVGKGNGRTAATVAGAATGVIAGDHLAGKTAFRDKTVTRCKTVIDKIRVPIEPSSHARSHKKHHHHN